LPSKSYSHIPSPRAIGTGSIYPWCCIWVQGCRTRRSKTFFSWLIKQEVWRAAVPKVMESGIVDA
jgi:hypothetical protein